jgi:GntR family transcriptional regulator, transcriptional repressor for pyruvate dehydrogenase complex
MSAEATPFEPIRRPNLVQEIVESIKRDLLAGRLTPGMRLPAEAELAQRFGVGRNSVREAMKTLQALGVVTIRQGDGTHIADGPTPALFNPLAFALLFESGSLSDVVELRVLIEAGYSQLAAQKATAADWQRIEAAQRAYEEYAARPDRDVEQHTALDLAFHFAVLDATHNPLVIKLGRTVEEIFYASIRGTLTRSRGRETGVEGHRRQVEAIRGGDPEAIRAAVAGSLEYWAGEVAGQSR